MSIFCNEQLNSYFRRYGIELIDFSVMSVNIPQDDVSFKRLKEAKDLAAKMKIAGKDVYQMERSFDVLDKAASNEGMGGQIMSMGTGLGVGMGVGTVMGSMVSQMINTNPNLPPTVPAPTYFIYVNGQQIGDLTAQNIAVYLAQGVVNANTLVWTAGMPSWIALSQVPELATLLNKQTPPPVPSQI